MSLTIVRMFKVLYDFHSLMFRCCVLSDVVFVDGVIYETPQFSKW